MRRREFISLVGAAAALYSTRSRAQQPAKTYLIGVLTAQLPSLIKALKDGLRKLGYIEGQNLKVECFGSPDTIIPTTINHHLA